MCAAVVVRDADRCHPPLVLLACAQRFIELVDTLLEAHLSEIGVTAEQFADVCARAKDSRDLNRRVFEHLLAVDDFLSECAQAYANACFCICICARTRAAPASRARHARVA